MKKFIDILSYLYAIISVGAAIYLFANARVEETYEKFSLSKIPESGWVTDIRMVTDTNIVIIGIIVIVQCVVIICILQSLKMIMDKLEL